MLLSGPPYSAVLMSRRATFGRGTDLKGDADMLVDAFSGTRYFLYRSRKEAPVLPVQIDLYFFAFPGNDIHAECDR